MTKTLSMISHKNYNLSANEDFVIYLTSKLITCFIGGFTLKMKCQSIAYLLNGVNIYIRFGNLKMKCTEYEICGQMAFKNARTMVFSKSGGWTMVFGWVPKILILWTDNCPCLNIPPVKSSWGGGNLTSSQCYLYFIFKSLNSNHGHFHK